MRQQPPGMDLVSGDLRGPSRVPGEAGVFIKTQAWMRGRSLDRELSNGEDPASSPVLTRRAAWLTSTKNRRALARSIRRLLVPPSGRRRGLSAAVPADRGELAGARMPLARVAAVLEIDEPVFARGVARLHLLLSEADSALYAPRRSGELRGELEGILDALEGREETW